MAVLKTSVLKVNANVLNLNYQDHKEMGNSEVEKMWHEILGAWAKEINLQHVSIFIPVLLLIITCSLVYKLWCKKKDLFFTFAIEIVSDNTYEYVEMCIWIYE